MSLRPGDLIHRGVVIGCLGLAAGAAIMMAQGFQERLGRRRQAYQETLLEQEFQELEGATRLSQPDTRPA